MPPADDAVTRLLADDEVGAKVATVVDKLQVNLDAADAENTILHTEVAHLKVEIQAANDHCTEVEQKTKDDLTRWYAAAKPKIENDRDRAKKENTALRTEADRWIAAAKTITKNRNHLKEENTALRTKAARLKDAIQVATKIVKDREWARLENATLRTGVAELTGRIRIATDKCKALKVELEQQNKKMTEVETKAAKLKGALTDAKLETVHSETQLHKGKEKLKKVQDKLSKSKSREHELTADLERTKIRLVEANDRRMEAETLKNKVIKRCTTEGRKRNEKLKEAEHKLDEQNAHVHKLQRDAAITAAREQTENAIMAYRISCLGDDFDEKLRTHDAAQKCIDALKALASQP